MSLDRVIGYLVGADWLATRVQIARNIGEGPAPVPSRPVLTPPAGPGELPPKPTTAAGVGAAAMGGHEAELLARAEAEFARLVPEARMSASRSLMGLRAPNDGQPASHPPTTARPSPASPHPSGLATSILSAEGLAGFAEADDANAQSLMAQDLRLQAASTPASPALAGARNPSAPGLYVSGDGLSSETPVGGPLAGAGGEATLAGTGEPDLLANPMAGQLAANLAALRSSPGSASGSLAGQLADQLAATQADDPLAPASLVNAEMAELESNAERQTSSAASLAGRAAQQRDADLRAQASLNSAALNSTVPDAAEQIAQQAAELSPGGLTGAERAAREGPLRDAQLFAGALSAINAGLAQTERAGIIASFVLNAAMIPGWPPPRPFEAARFDATVAVRQLQAGMDEAQAAANLGKLGIAGTVLAQIKAFAEALKRRAKLWFGVLVLLSAALTVLASLKDEEEEPDAEELLAANGRARLYVW